MKCSVKETPPAPEGKYMTTVRVGPRGQIVIPKEARELYGIRPGDSILLLADQGSGIALQKMENCKDFFAKAFPRKDPP